MRILQKGYDAKELEGHYNILVPSGIGEFCWMWAKLSNVPGPFFVHALDGAPRRLHQFAELHPNVSKFCYYGMDYSQIREFQKFNELYTWERISTLFPKGGGLCLLACNPHLEEGRPLAEWLPDLPTRYSYTVSYQQMHYDEASRVLHDHDPKDFYIGISCASYRGAAAWKTWEHQEWTKFLQMIADLIPNVKFVLMGGSWDDLTSAVYNPATGLRFQLDARGLPPVGTTTFGGAMRVLHSLDAYIGFSSGLGHVAAHLCGTPVAMFWPDHEKELLARSWCDPDLLACQKYLPMAWNTPEQNFEVVKQWLLNLAKGRK